MNRLTKRYKNRNITLDASCFTETQETIDREIRNFAPVQVAVERLAEYEDAEEQELLIKPPCKAGDVVYRISTDMIFPVEVYQIRDDGLGWHMMIAGGIYISFSDFGKTVFLTKEAAEQALKARKSKNE